MELAVRASRTGGRGVSLSTESFVRPRTTGAHGETSMLGVKARIILVAAGLGFFLLGTGCRSQSSPEATEKRVETGPASTGAAPTSGFTAESATLDGGADVGPNCAAAGDPTLGVDAGSSCTGALAQATFTYGLCACTTLQASNSLTTDGFDSTKGAPDGGLGGNVGANAAVSWSTASSIGGTLWTPGNVTSSNPSIVRGDLHLGGTLGGGATFTVDGNAFDVNALPGNAKVLGTVSKVSSVATPCDCTNVVPVASITAAHRASNNDNSTIGLPPTVAVGNNPARIDLPCGNYYLSQINAAQALTIAVHGHTALYVDGNLNASGDLAVQMDPAATLDLFVAGTFNASNGLTLGSTSDPAHCRAYVAGATFNVSGSATMGCNVYAPEAQVSLANGSTTFGAIFGKSIQANGNATVHYDTSVASASGECCSAGTCDDGNPCTVDACNGDGTCSHTAAANGATCTGTNKCDQAYSCQAGACVGSSPVICAASDGCHVAGTCDPTTGACSNPDAPNGTTCNDGNACTQSDTCQSGACTGSDPVTCAAEDTCHVAGTCNPATGACSTPPAANGTTCSDGNACTQTDTCENGVCTGSNPVTCVASGACHAAGTCDLASGTCSNPTLANGTNCNDGNACTQNDSCESGVCTGSNLVVCAASDSCHTAGTCNPSTGACSNPAAANGTPCSDGNACTQTDSCQNGTCTGTNQVICTAPDACHVAGICNSSKGACSNPTAANGTICDDGDACTQTDSCQNGTCTGSDQVTCAAADACHVVGTCDSMSGQCSSPIAANGTSCNDGNPCTLGDTCTGGTCSGVAGGYDAGISDGGRSGNDSSVADSGDDASDAEPSGEPPQWSAASVITAAPTGPASTRLAWTAATDRVGVTRYELFENGTLVATVAGTMQSYLVSGLTTGPTYTFAVQAGNATGALSSNGPTTTAVAEVPVLSVAGAPPVDPTVTSSIASIASFLYAGPNPVQLGLKTVIDGQRVVVLQGQIIDNLGSPLPGAAVTIADHPEYGYTVSRADGHYDLAVNGGGTVVISFDMTGTLHAERSQRVPWASFVHVPNVALVPEDVQATQVDLSGTAGPQVARGSQVQDRWGARTATLLMAPGTTAQMTLPNGESQVLDVAHIRATEYTVGDTGPAAMPADLPATSGYTYAAAFTVDEADAAQATAVSFSQPVAVYLEDFLNIFVGVDMPSGYYDANVHSWIPSGNGRIVAVLSVTGGSATLDVDGGGQPATPAELAALGITGDELGQVASLYSPGQALWRVPVQHFTPWDFNEGVGPSAGACAPNACGGTSGGDPGNPGGGTGGGDCDNMASGCVIDIEAQILGERVAVGGTPFTLNYRSDRMQGYLGPYVLNIPLTGANPPPSLQGVQLEVDIAGEQLTQAFGAAPRQQYTFEWDGNDGYGRPVQGQQPVSVKLGYVYNLVYIAPSDNPLNLDPNYDSDFGHFTYFGAPASVDGRQITLSYDWTGMLGENHTSPQDGLGGWTLSGHDTYDPASETVFYGDGHKRTVDTLPQITTTIAGNPNTAGGFSGDSGPATQAIFNLAQSGGSIATKPDGTIYILDSGNCRVRAITPDGIINTVAGNGQCGNVFAVDGDGGIATAAQISGVGSLAVGLDGTLYIADGPRVRHVDSQGIIHTVAGAGCEPGTIPSLPNGVPALDACFEGNHSSGFSPLSIAFAPDGTMYLLSWDPIDSALGLPAEVLFRVTADGYAWILMPGDGNAEPPPGGVPLSQAHLDGPVFGAPYMAVGNDGVVYLSDGVFIRRVGNDGLFSTIAGNGAAFNVGAGDGSQATTTAIAPGALAVDPQGTVIFIDYSGFSTSTDDLGGFGAPRVRAVLPDGVLATLAGDGTSTPFGQPLPTGTRLATGTPIDFPAALALAPDGTLLVLQNSAEIGTGGALSRVASAVPGSPVGGFDIADENGTAVDVFDDSGRHLRTQDALTGATLYAFTYDSGGRLASVIDVDGNTTTIQRDGSASPTAIVGPYGQLTALAVDVNGNLSSIQDAAGDTYSYAYNGGGLLQATTTPRGGLYQYGFDTLGRLLQDTDPAGGGATLSTAGNVVTRVTSMGVVSSYEIDNLPSTDVEQVVTGPDGLKGTFIRGHTGTNTQTSPDGTITTWTLSADPRFGVQSPVTSSTTVMTPSGLTSTSAITRNVTLSDPTNPFSVQSATTTYTLNGNAWTSTFDSTGMTQTIRSPVGRQAVTTLDAAHRPIQIAMANIVPLMYHYDTHGRLQTVSQGSHTWSESYDALGYAASTTDPLGLITSFVNDSVGRPLDTTLPDGRLLVSTYDADSNETSLTLPAGGVHQLGYTPVDQLASYAPPSLGPSNWATQYTYDLDRRSTLESRPDGVSIASIYDSASRLLSVTTPQGVQSFLYDPATGHRTSISAASGETTSYSYDGFLSTGVAWSGPVAGSLVIGFDDNFRMTSQALNNIAVPFGYDADGLLVQAGALALVLDPENGRLTGTTLGSSADVYQYDASGLLASYNMECLNTALYSESVVRDAAARITQKTETVGATTHVWSYTYDVNGRLTDVAEDASFAAHYAYDVDNNRTTATNIVDSVNATYDTQDRLLTYGASTYAYTANGDMASKVDSSGTTTYSYSAFGELLSVTEPDGTFIQYVHDAEHRRLGKSVNGTLTKAWLYDGRFRIVAELDGSGNVVSRFVGGIRPNGAEYMLRGGNVYRLVRDHLGSVRLVVDVNAGTVAEEIDYDEFGVVTTDTEPSFQPFGFGGGLYDSDTGLVRFGLRDYDASVGRWTTKDPTGLDGGTNLYEYAMSDPINALDIGGTDPADCATALAQEGLICFAAGVDPLLVPACIAAEQNAATQCGGMGGGGAAGGSGGSAGTCGSGKPWQCKASCNVEGTEPHCTGRVKGSASGSSENAACREAKRDATQQAPRGCYARHCQCDCSQ
jgi:RHS repeat-associated protein